MKKLLFLSFILSFELYATTLYCKGFLREFQFDSKGKLIPGAHIDAGHTFSLEISSDGKSIIDHGTKYYFTKHSSDVMYLYTDEARCKNVNLDRVSGEYSSFPSRASKKCPIMIEAKCKVAKPRF